MVEEISIGLAVGSDDDTFEAPSSKLIFVFSPLFLLLFDIDKAEHGEENPVIDFGSKD